MAARREVSRKSGRSVGDFIIEKDIGKGSFAQVYSGLHKKSGATVAIKSVELDRLNKKLKENLYGEIKILKTLRHPHIVCLHDCVESSTHINLIMEFCELGDLSHFIKRRDKLGAYEMTSDMARKYPPGNINSGLHEVVIRHFLKQLSSALEFLRSKNYVHRDVKPQNLLLIPAQKNRDMSASRIMEGSEGSLIPVAGLTSLPMLKLADFGFARVLPSTSLADTLCGSPLYMAPEILRYERYDAKADLWSVGTVLYEMATGRPPFRAKNHVELLRKIENAEDTIRFPKETIITADLKGLIRALLKRSPVERLNFENFFAHPVVTGDIPGLVEDDVPKLPRKQRAELEPPAPSPIQSESPRERERQSTESGPVRTSSFRNRGQDVSRSPRDQQLRTPPSSSPSQARPRPREEVQRLSSSPREAKEGLGIRRPAPQHTASMPNHPRVAERPTRTNTYQDPRPTETRRTQPTRTQTTAEEEKAAQDVMFERDYVVVERRHVEVNALADELAANQLPRANTISRRATQQGVPTSATGAIPTPTSRTALIAQGKAAHDRRSSYERSYSGSPGSASSAISKAIQDASLRLFGFKVPPIMSGKGPSPPLYQPFPDYPIPATVGFLGDLRSSPSTDEDARAAQTIEDCATRSDCVYGFAEVKYKQLVPLAPSGETLGGLSDEPIDPEDEGLTVDAIVLVSEEAMVLYVKSLTLLAKAMDIASLWWSKRSRGEIGTGVSAAVSQVIIQRINAVVQWVRSRFNEVLEKSEVVRLKLLDAQRLLPEDHPSHPSNQDASLTSSVGGSGMGHVFLTPGINAEKLMWDRALEMSRVAAIDEVTNTNLAGCELSYITAIRMLEAVLDTDDDSSSKKLTSGREIADSETGEEQHVRSMIKMVAGRLTSVRKKQQMIAEAEAQSLRQQATRRQSGDVTPRSVPSYTSG